LGTPQRLNPQVSGYANYPSGEDVGTAYDLYGAPLFAAGGQLTTSQPAAIVDLASNKPLAFVSERYQPETVTVTPADYGDPLIRGGSDLPVGRGDPGYTAQPRVRDIPPLETVPTSWAMGPHGLVFSSGGSDEPQAVQQMQAAIDQWDKWLGQLNLSNLSRGYNDNLRQSVISALIQAMVLGTVPQVQPQPDAASLTDLARRAAAAVKLNLPPGLAA
jgi:hypothetical protein